MRLIWTTTLLAAWSVHTGAAQVEFPRQAAEDACIALNQRLVSEVREGRTVEAEQALSDALPANADRDAQLCAGLTWANLATLASFSGRLSDSERLALRSVAILEKAYSNQDPLLLRPLFTLAAARIEQGKTAMARQTLQRMKTIPAERPAHSALVHGIGASLLEREGKAAEAIPDARAAVTDWERAGRGVCAIAWSQPGRLDFFKVHDSSFTLVANTSATFQTGKKYPNEVLLITGLPFAPTVSAHVDLGLGDPHCAAGEPCGRLRNLAISPDGDTALVTSDPSDGTPRDVSALILLRNVRAFAQSRNKADLRIRVFKATDFPQLDNVAGIVFGPDGRWAVVNTGGPGPVDVTYTHARGTLVVITGLPDNPRFAAPFAVPTHSLGNISLSLDGGTLLLNDTSDRSTGVLRSNQIIVQGIQPGGGSPRIVATSSFSLPSGDTDVITPVRDAKLTLDGRFVIAPLSAIRSFDQNGQPIGENQIAILGPIRRGGLDTRLLKQADGVMGGPLYAAIHPDGNTALVANTLDLGSGELLTQLASGNPSKFAVKPLPFPFFGPPFPLGPTGPPVLASHVGVVFTPDGNTALVENWVIPTFADSPLVPSITALTGFDTGNIQVASHLIDPILNTFDNNQQIATVPPGLLDYLRLYVPAGGARDNLTSLVNQAIASSDRGDPPGVTVAILVRFILTTAGMGLQGTLTGPQLTTLNTLATVGIQDLIGSAFNLFSAGPFPDAATSVSMASLRDVPTSGSELRVSIIDSNGIERRATVLHASPTGVDYLVPEGTEVGKATVLVTAGGDVLGAAMLDLEPVFPDIVKAGGTQRLEPILGPRDPGLSTESLPRLSRFSVARR